MEYARWDLKLGKTDKDGISEREHLEVVKKTTGKTPLALVPPTDFPKDLEHVWIAFLELSERRGYSQVGPLPITYSDIFHYKEVTGNQIDPNEVSTILELDRIYMKVANG